MSTLTRDLKRKTPIQFKKKYGVSPSEMSKEFIINNFIHEDGMYINPDIIDQYRIGKLLNLPAGYTWFGIDELYKFYVVTKNGQASTGDIKNRVLNFSETIDIQVLWDVILDDCFIKKSYDQILNSQISKDFKESKDISWLGRKNFKIGIRSSELIQIPISELHNYASYKRESLKNLTGKTILKIFKPNTSHNECLNKLCKNDTMYFLLNCVMRFGKSFMFYEYIKTNYHLKGINKVHIMFCHDTKTYGGWKTKHREYYSDMFDLVELKDKKDFDFRKEYDRNTIVLISPQLISANSNLNILADDSESEKGMLELSKFDIVGETIFVDEAHQYFTSKWKKYYESIRNITGQIILASGTAANLIIKYTDLIGFDENKNMHTSDLYSFKESLLSDLNIDLRMKVKLINLNGTDGNDVNLHNLLDGNLDDGLVNLIKVERFLETILDGGESSPFEKAKHHLVLIDTKAAAQTLYDFIKNNRPDFVPIGVYGSNRDVKDETSLQDKISDANKLGKGTITISCGSMIQGVSIREWKNIINLSSKSTYEIYYQLFGRGLEFDNKIDKKEKVEIVNVTMWDYNPHRIYKVGADFVKSVAMTNGGNISEAIKRFFKVVDITNYIKNDDGSESWITIDESELGNKIKEYVDSKTLKKGFRTYTTFNKKFSILDLPKELTDWLATTHYGNNSSAKSKIDVFNKELKKQKTNYSKGVGGGVKPSNSIDVDDILRKSFDYALDKLDIVWNVYKSQNKVNDSISELLNYSDESQFCSGFGLPNTKISKLFAEQISKYGILHDINARLLSECRIPNIKKCLNMTITDFLNYCDLFDKIYTYNGDDTQLSVRDAYNILKKELKKTKAKVGQKFVVQCAKSGSINLALTYLLKENSKQIFGRELTNQEIIESVSYEDENTFFESLINTMGFSKTTKTNKDFIIINPPYSSGLHLDIFVKSFNDELNAGGTLICVHRETPVITKTPNPNKKTKEYRDIMLNNTSEITFFDGNTVFHTAQFFAPLIVSRVKKDSNKSLVKINSNHLKSPYSYEISDFNDAFIHSNVEKTIRIRKKLLDKVNTEQLPNFNEMSTKKIKNSPYYVNIKQIGGHGMVDGKINKDFYCLISPKFEYDLENQITNDINNCLTPAGRGGGIRTNSYNEAVNIFEFMKTKSARFFISLTKIDQNIWDGDMLSILPYLDFTKKWNDANIFEYFELEDDLIEYINEYIEPIYDYEKSN
jgi:hypothetical protein